MYKKRCLCWYSSPLSVDSTNKGDYNEKYWTKDRLFFESRVDFWYRFQY